MWKIVKPQDNDEHEPKGGELRRTCCRLNQKLDSRNKKSLRLNSIKTSKKGCPKKKGFFDVCFVIGNYDVSIIPLAVGSIPVTSMFRLVFLILL